MRRHGRLLAGVYAESLILADGGWRGRCSVEEFIAGCGQEAEKDDYMFGMLKAMSDARRNELIQRVSGDVG